VPGNRLALAIRVGREIQGVGLLHCLDNGVHVLLVLFDQLILHVETVFGVDRALLRDQVAHVAVRREAMKVLAQILGHGLGLGRGLDNDQVLRHGGSGYARGFLE
jgi:hypothetical protein